MADKPFSWGSNISKGFFSLCIGYFAKPDHTTNMTIHLSSYQPYQSPLSNQPDCPLTFISWIIYGRPDRRTTDTLRRLVYVDLLSIQNLWHFPHSVVSNALEAGNLTPSARFCVVLLRCCFVYLFISFYQNTHRTQNAKCAEPRL